MEKQSRIKNSLRNIVFGVGGQCLILLFSFISRTVFIKYLGVEYLGINGLFYNILFVLNLADLGLGTAVTYSLYKPLAENNIKKINTLVLFYKNIYRKIALAVFVFGLLLVPFLDKIINLETNIEYITIYYLLYVVNSAISYLFVYKTTIIFAAQKDYILKKYSILTSVLNFVLQILSLTIFQSFILYLLSMIITTFINNFLGAKKAEKLYLRNDNNVEKISDIEKREIFSNVKSMFIYRVSGVIMNNTTNIFISIFIGTVWVGYYSNYLMLITGITSFTNIISNALQASVGNLVCTAPIKKQCEIYYDMNFLVYAIIGIISIVFFSFVDSFIIVWLGKDFVLNNEIVLLTVLNFFIPNVLRTTSIFRDTTKLFKKTKYVFLFTAILNLVFIFLLENNFGLAGILIAAVLARLLTNFWYEPYWLSKMHFEENPINYFKKITKYIVILLCIGTVNKYFMSFIEFENMMSVIVGSIIDLIIISVVYSIIFCKTKEFEYVKNIVVEKFINK